MCIKVPFERWHLCKGQFRWSNNRNCSLRFLASTLQASARPWNELQTGDAIHNSVTKPCAHAASHSSWPHCAALAAIAFWDPCELTTWRIDGWTWLESSWTCWQICTITFCRKNWTCWGRVWALGRCSRGRTSIVCVRLWQSRGVLRPGTTGPWWQTARACSSCCYERHKQGRLLDLSLRPRRPRTCNCIFSMKNMDLSMPPFKDNPSCYIPILNGTSYLEED